MIVIQNSFRQLVSSLGCIGLLLLLHSWILIDIHQISNNSSSLSYLLLQLLLLFSTQILDFFPCCHVVIEVLVNHLVFVCNLLLSLVALASILVVQTLFNHGQATSIVVLLVNLVPISIISVTWGQELIWWLRNHAAASVISLATADEKLALLPLAYSMLVNNIDLAVLSISIDVLHAVVHDWLVSAAVFFVLTLLVGETLATLV